MAGEDFTIKVNQRQLREITEIFSDAPRILKSIQVSAINQTATFAKGEIARTFAGPKGLFNVSQVEARKVISVTSRARTEKLSGTIHVKGKAIPLAKFGARQTAKGVTIGIFRGGARQLFLNEPKYFLMRIKHATGKTAKIIARRLGKARKKLEYKIWGPSIADGFKMAPNRVRLLETEIGKRLNKQMLTQIDRRLKLKSGRAAEVLGGPGL